jgi:hypothetical protein
VSVVKRTAVLGTNTLRGVASCSAEVSGPGFGTLRTNGVGLGADEVGRTLVAGCGGWATLVRSLVISQRALLWVSVSGASGDCGDGLDKALTISLRQATMVAVEELSGSLTLVGYQVTVSQIRTSLDSQIQICQHR